MTGMSIAIRVLPVARYFRKLQESNAMNVRWQGALCVVMLAIAPGWSHSEEALLCRVDNPKDCKTAAEWERKQAAEFANQRRYAEALPFDYRDLVHALLVEYIRSTSLPGADHQYFVTVFGGDVDAALTAKLQASGLEVLPGSAWNPNEGPPQSDRSGSRVKLHVAELEQVAADTFTIRIGYYCGPRCAASEQCKLQKNGSSWRIVSRQQDWIA